MVGRSVVDRSRVIALRHRGLTPAAIVRETRFDKKFVLRWSAAADANREPADRARSGRRRALPPVAVRTVRAMMKGKSRRSTRKVTKLYAERKHVTVSHQTIWRAAREAGLKPLHKPRKPLLTEHHRQRRLDFVELYKDTDWRRVLFTDEKTFMLFGKPNKRNDVIWEESSQNVPITPTVKHAQKVHVWGGISYFGKTELYIFTENLNAQLLKVIFKARLPQVADMFPDRRWMLQQDNDPKHTSKTISRWLKKNVPAFIPKEHWPPNSPDLNIIEALWGILQDRVYARAPRTVDRLKRIIRKEWDRIDLCQLRRLVDSIPRRFAAVRASQGGSTKY